VAVTKILHILEFTPCNRFQHALTAQGVIENHDPVEPVLNLLPLDKDATLIEGADGLEYPIACRKDIVESRCLPFGPPQCIRLTQMFQNQQQKLYRRSSYHLLRH